MYYIQLFFKKSLYILFFRPNFIYLNVCIFLFISYQLRHLLKKDRIFITKFNFYNYIRI